MFAREFPVLTNKQGKDRLNFNCASHHVLDCLLGIKRHMLGHDDVAELPQVGHFLIGNDVDAVIHVRDPLFSLHDVKTECADLFRFNQRCFNRVKQVLCFNCAGQ